MKRNICVMAAMLFGLITGSCTKDNYIDTGVSNGRHDCSLLEYMKGGSYDWDSTVLMVQRAGLESLFERNELDGKTYEGLTFFAPTNHSIRRYLMEQKLKQVSDLDPAMCRTLLLRCFIEGKYYRTDFPAGKHASGYAVVGEGGKEYKTLAGTTLWVYTFAEDFAGIPNIGSITIYLKMLGARNQEKFEVASADIEPNGCIVHAMEYRFTIDDWLMQGETLY